MTASRALITNDDNAEDYYVHEADTRSTGIQNRVLKLSGINRKDRRIVHSLQGRYAGLFACRPQQPAADSRAKKPDLSAVRQPTLMKTVH
jgi:hypothetical protein